MKPGNQLKSAIESERIRRGLSWYALAATSGVGESVLSRWNAGARLREDHLEQLLDALDLVVMPREPDPITQPE